MLKGYIEYGYLNIKFRTHIYWLITIHILIRNSQVKAYQGMYHILSKYISSYSWMKLKSTKQVI